jgi:hypothetical protein
MRFFAQLKLVFRNIVFSTDVDIYFKNEDLVITFQAHFTPTLCTYIAILSSKTLTNQFKISSNLFVIVKTESTEIVWVLTLFVRYPKLTLDGANKLELRSCPGIPFAHSVQAVYFLLGKIVY